MDSRSEVIHSLKQRGYEIDFACGIFLGRDNDGLVLQPETAARVGALGAELGLDIFALFDDDEEPTTSESSAGSDRSRENTA
jgi:hypothetical protein